MVALAKVIVISVSVWEPFASAYILFLNLATPYTRPAMAATAAYNSGIL